MSVLTVVKVGGSLCADEARLAGLLAALADGVHGACVIVPGGGAFADAVRGAQVREGFDDAAAHRLALDAMGRMAEVFCGIEPRLVRSSSIAKAANPRGAMLAHPGTTAPDGSFDAPRGPLSQGERAGVRGVTFPVSSHPSPCPSPARERGPALASFAVANCVAAISHRGTGEAAARYEAMVWDPALLKPGHPDIPETWDVTSDSLALWLAREVGAARCVLVKSAVVPPGRSAADLARLGLVDAAFPAFAARFAGTIELWGPNGVATLADRIAA